MEEFEYNKLYTRCSKFLDKQIDEDDNNIAIRFGLWISPDEGQVRIKHINQLYFSILHSILTEEQIKELFRLKSFVRANDREGSLTNSFENIMYSIMGGDKNYGRNN